MGNKERPTILDRLLEMLRGKGNSRPEVDNRKAEPDRAKIARKTTRKKRKRAA
jgi:hypothetical protein